MLLKFSAILTSILLFSLGTAAPVAAADDNPLNSSSLWFEENRGQHGPQIEFVSRTPSMTFVFAGNSIVIQLPTKEEGKGQSITLLLEGAKRKTAIEGVDHLPATLNYFRGDDPALWRTGIDAFRKIRYSQVYQGVDLVFYGSGRQLEYDFVVSPGGRPAEIGLRVIGENLAMRLDRDGDLILGTSAGDLVFRKPAVRQISSNGVSEHVQGAFRIQGRDRLAFAIGSYDHTRPLIIDPVLSFSSYLGGSSKDGGYGVALDSSGNVYVAGSTASVNFPLKNPLQGSLKGSSDVFVAKLAAQGHALVYATYLGGAGQDLALDVAVDSSGNAYVTGETESSDFPVASAAQSAFGGRGGLFNYGDAFAAKISSSGSSLVYSTFIGGSRGEQGLGIAVDGSGAAYVTGETNSENLPTTAGAFQRNFNGGTFDAFVAKVAPSGASFGYLTYLGHGSYDGAEDIAVDSGGNAFVVGSTQYSFPVTPGAFQTDDGGGIGDVFITKINPAGSDLVYSTFLGGYSNDTGSGIAIDPFGCAYVTGYTGSGDFPLKNPFQTEYRDFLDAFVTKLNASGSALVYSTFLGGKDPAGQDIGRDVTVDANGNAYVTGTAATKDFPLVNPIQGTHGGGTCGTFLGNPIPCDDIFLTKVNPAGGVVFSTYHGGSNSDQGEAVAVDNSGNVYVAGLTDSTNLPTATPIQGSYGGGLSDLVISRMDTAQSGCASGSFCLGGVTPGAGPVNGGTQVTLKGNGFVSGASVSFGGGAATSVNVADSTTLTATTPAHEFGAVDVSVTIPGNPTSTLSSAFVYQAAAIPVSLTPGNGSVEAGWSTTFTVMLGLSQSTETLVQLSSSAPARASVSPTVRISAGATTATFNVTGVAPGSVTIKATLPANLGYASASSMLTVVSPLYTPKLAVPGQGRLAGSGGSFFKTSFWMTNPLSAETRVRLKYVPSTGGSRGGAATSKEVTIPPNQSVAYDDVLAEAFGATSDTSGVIIVEVGPGATTPIVTSRTFNDSPSGTFGQYIPAITLPTTSTEQSAYLYGLGGDTASRSNVGVVNLSSTEELNASVSVLDAAGTQIGSNVSVTVAPQSFVQVNRLNEAAGAGNLSVFTARIVAASGSSKFFAYASKLDNKTSDPIFIPSTLPTGSKTLWIDGIGAAPGAGGTFFRSNLVLKNFYYTNMNVDVSFTKWGDTSPSQTRSISLQGSETKTYTDVVTELFGLSGVAGSLTITSGFRILSWARTFNDQGMAGTFGQFIPAFTSADLIPATGAIFHGISENASFRTNMGFVNRGSAVVNVLVTVWNREGDKLGERTYAVEPGQTVVKTRVVLDLGVSTLSHGYINVNPTPGGAVYAWASSVDNTSTDQTFNRPINLPTTP